MKNIGKLVLIISLVIFSSCSTDEIVPDTQSIESETLVTKNPTTCKIKGSSTAYAGCTTTYTATNNFSAGSITWSVLSGNISIVSGQGTNSVQLNFASNFSGGEIRWSGVNGPDNCATTKVISSATAPNDIVFDQISGECPGDIFEINADPNGSTNNGTYTWSATNGATIISGQGTDTARFQSSSSSSFSFVYTVVFTPTGGCSGTSTSASNLAEFDGSCGGGLGGF